MLPVCQITTLPTAQIKKCPEYVWVSMRGKESAWVLGQRLVLYDVDDVFSASAPEVKVAMINIFITRVGHMCNVRGVEFPASQM